MLVRINANGTLRYHWRSYLSASERRSTFRDSLSPCCAVLESSNRRDSTAAEAIVDICLEGVKRAIESAIKGCESRLQTSWSRGARSMEDKRSGRCEDRGQREISRLRLCVCAETEMILLSFAGKRILCRGRGHVEFPTKHGR